MSSPSSKRCLTRRKNPGPSAPTSRPDVSALTSVGSRPCPPPVRQGFFWTASCVFDQKPRRTRGFCTVLTRWPSSIERRIFSLRGTEPQRTSLPVGPCVRSRIRGMLRHLQQLTAPQLFLMSATLLLLRSRRWRVSFRQTLIMVENWCYPFRHWSAAVLRVAPVFSVVLFRAAAGDC